MYRTILRRFSPLFATAAFCLSPAFGQGPPAGTPPSGTAPAGPAAAPATGPSRVPVRTEEAPAAPIVEHGAPAVQYFVALVCTGAVMIVICYPSRKG